MHNNSPSPQASAPEAKSVASNPVTPAEFHDLIAQVTARIAGRPLDTALDEWLNTQCGPDDSVFQRLKQACESGVAQGWLCNREAGGIRYGRIFKPAPELHGFSVDVVDMQDIAGPHHTHPHGEIDLVMPLEPGALFDGRPAGWVVYPPGSAHRPTVSRGRALVLYLLPEGAITFTS